MIKIDFTLIITAFNFGLLFLFLKVYFFTPLSKQIKERQTRLTEIDQTTLDNQQKVSELNDDYNNQMRKAMQDIDHMIEKEQQSFWQNQRKILGKKQDELLEIEEKKEQEISLQMEKLTLELNSNVSQTSGVLFDTIIQSKGLKKD